MSTIAEIIERSIEDILTQKAKFHSKVYILPHQFTFGRFKKCFKNFLHENFSRSLN